MLMQNQSLKQDQPKLNLNLFIIKKFKLLAFGLTVLLILFFYFVLVKPQKELIASAQRNDLQPLIDQKNSKTELVKNLKDRTKDYAIIKDLRLQSLEQMLPDISSKDDLYIVLEQIIKERGWQITDLKLDAPVDITEYGDAATFNSLEMPVRAVHVTIRFDDEAGGLGYEDIKEIISILYSQKRIVNIKSLEIGEKKQSSGSAKSRSAHGGSGMEFKFDVFFIDNAKLDAGEAGEESADILDPTIMLDPALNQIPAP